MTPDPEILDGEQTSQRLEPDLFRTGPWYTISGAWGLLLWSFSGILFALLPPDLWLHPAVIGWGAAGTLLLGIEGLIWLFRSRARRRLLHALANDSRFWGAEAVVIQKGLHIELGSLDPEGLGGALLHSSSSWGSGSPFRADGGEAADAGGTALATLRWSDGSEIDLGESRGSRWTETLARQCAALLGLPCLDQRRGGKALDTTKVRLPAGLRPLDLPARLD